MAVIVTALVCRYRPLDVLVRCVWDVLWLRARVWDMDGMNFRCAFAGSFDLSRRHPAPKREIIDNFPIDATHPTALDPLLPLLNSFVV